MTQSASVPPRHAEAELAQQVVGFRVRRVQEPDPAEPAEAGRIGGSERVRRAVDRAPVQFPDRPGQSQRSERRPAQLRCRIAGRPFDRRQHERAAGDREQKIGHRHRPMTPLPDRSQGGIDHRRAKNGEDRDRHGHGSGQPDGQASGRPGGDEPRQRGRCGIGGERRHRFARQPGRAPLGEGAPGSPAPAQVESGGEQPHRGQKNPDCQGR